MLTRIYIRIVFWFLLNMSWWKWKYLYRPIQGYRAWRWHVFSKNIAKLLDERSLREGFMRRVLSRGDVKEGDVIPRIKVRNPNVTATFVNDQGYSRTKIYPDQEGD